MDRRGVSGNGPWAAKRIRAAWAQMAQDRAPRRADHGWQVDPHEESASAERPRPTGVGPTTSTPFYPKRSVAPTGVARSESAGSSGVSRHQL